MKFKELNNGQVFEFESTASGLERGPWVKTGTRTYEAAAVVHRLNGRVLRVGSWNVETKAAAWPEV